MLFDSNNNLHFLLCSLFILYVNNLCRTAIQIIPFSLLSVVKKLFRCSTQAHNLRLPSLVFHLGPFSVVFFFLFAKAILNRTIFMATGLW